MIKKFKTESEYRAAGYPTQESRVSEVVETGNIYYDGVNVKTESPQMGAAVYKKDGQVHFFVGGDALQHGLLTADGYEGIGQIIGWRDGMAIYMDKDITSLKYLDVCQYAITAISSTNLSIKLRMSPDYTVDTVVEVTLASTAIDSANASAISAAVAAKAAAVGDTKDWWAYLDGNRIVIQCDTCVDYRFYNVSATGCTITHCTWDDMPASSEYFKSNGRMTNYFGCMNIARMASYYSTNGRATAGAADVWHGAIGANDSPLTSAAFLASSLYGTGGHQYPTYEDYIRGEFGIAQNQKYGSFDLPAPEILAQKYGYAVAPVKGGGTKYKFPALHHPLTIDRGVDGLRAGNLFLAGVREGVAFMNDENMAIINATRQKMGHTLISNSSTRWFAERYNVFSARFFYGTLGTLTNSGVSSTSQVQGLALLRI